MPSSPSPPEFFIDRSLGRLVIAQGLRDRGWSVRTLHEVYGARDEKVQDVEWLARCGKEGWVALCKDTRIRYRTAERDAVIAHGVRLFVLTNGNLTGPQQVARFVDNERRILEECATHPGPFIDVVHSTRIERLYPPKRTR